MKLWVDDVRPAPDGWEWAKNVHTAVACLRHYDVTEMSLDHDLGEGRSPLDHGAIYDTKPIIYWLIDEHIDGRNFWPNVVRVHSSNPAGRDWLVGMIERYKP